MPEKWSPEEIRAYRLVIRYAPQARQRAEANQRRLKDRLFERLHGKPIAEPAGEKK